MPTNRTQSTTLKAVRKLNRANTNPPPAQDGGAEPISSGVDTAFNTAQLLARPTLADPNAFGDDLERQYYITHGTFYRYR